MITTGRPRSSSITVTTNHRYAFVLDNRATASSVPMASANTRVSAAAVIVLTSPMPNAVQTATKYWLTGLKIGPHLSASSWPFSPSCTSTSTISPASATPATAVLMAVRRRVTGPGMS